MQIEIDTSGLWGRTSEPSVFAYSNSSSKAVRVSAAVKGFCLQEVRKRCGKTTISEYLRLYAICLFLLIKDDLGRLGGIVIDLEYKKRMGEIRSMLLELIAQARPQSAKIAIKVKQIGKHSRAHAKANEVFKKIENPEREISATEILELF